MRAGRVYRFNYLQPGHDQQVVGRVIKVRDLDTEPLAPATYATSHVPFRGQLLYTVRNTSGEVKNFYAGSIINVEPVSLFERVQLWWSGLSC